jgi:hypothetical protein
MAAATTAASDLKRALARFIAESGKDPKFAQAVGEARKLDGALRGVGQPSDQPTPGQRAAGITSLPNKQNGPQGPNSAKGPGHNLPPQFLRKRMKGGATAQKGS